MCSSGIHDDNPAAALRHPHAFERVTEVFIRMNSVDTLYSRAGFAMSKIAVNETCGGNPPEGYFTELAERCNGGATRYGGIADMAQLRNNLRQSYVPDSLLGAAVSDYDEFLEQRRVLMAWKFQTYFGGL